MRSRIWFLLKLLKKLPAVVQHLYTLLLVIFGWALFYFEDLSALGGFLGKLFVPVSSAQSIGLILGYLPMTAAAVFCATPAWKKLPGGRIPEPVRDLALAAVFLLCMASLASQSYNPFIYFRF